MDFMFIQTESIKSLEYSILASVHRKIHVINPFNPKYLDWYNLNLDLEHTI